MLGRQELVAFVATTNPTRAREFYGEVLGLSLVSDDPYALVFEANGATLRIQKVEELTPQPFTALGWTVSDIDGAVDELTKREVRLERYAGMDQDSRGVWASRSGARIAWFKDPDGNTLSLTELERQ
jgi:catechol 2,3-dioxygenase-like lactoylglutathione lyase family enzyme